MRHASQCKPSKNLCERRMIPIKNPQNQLSNTLQSLLNPDAIKSLQKLVKLAQSINHLNDPFIENIPESVQSDATNYANIVCEQLLKKPHQLPNSRDTHETITKICNFTHAYNQKLKNKPKPHNGLPSAMPVKMFDAMEWITATTCTFEQTIQSVQSNGLTEQSVKYFTTNFDFSLILFDIEKQKKRICILRILQIQYKVKHQIEFPVDVNDQQHLIHQLIHFID